MKVRNGFVSNSSSSSFVLNKNDISAMQAELIRNHGEEGEKYGIQYCTDTWSIHEDGELMEGYTSMDNFDMESFMKRIGVDMSKVKFGGHMSDWDDEEEDW